MKEVCSSLASTSPFWSGLAANTPRPSSDASATNTEQSASFANTAEVNAAMNGADLLCTVRPSWFDSMVISNYFLFFSLLFYVSFFLCVVATGVVTKHEAWNNRSLMRRGRGRRERVKANTRNQTFHDIEQLFNTEFGRGTPKPGCTKQAMA